MSLKFEPINGSHSISNVEVTIFLSAPFVDPKSTFEKEVNKEGGFFVINFPKRSLLKESKIEVNNKDKKISIKDSNAGIALESFTADGDVQNIVVIQNMPNSKAILKIQTKTYKDWSSFKDWLEPVIKNSIKLVSGGICEAVNLAYTDKFIKNPSFNTLPEINIEELFKMNSTLLPTDFFNNNSGNLVMVTKDNNSEEENQWYWENRSEMRYDKSNSIPVSIIHTVALRFKNYVLLSTIDGFNFLINSLERLHKKNKEYLRQILSDPYIDRIGIIKEEI